MLAGIISSRFRRVYRAASADRNNGIDIIFLYDCLHAVNFTIAGNSAEYFVASLIIRAGEAFFQLVVAGFVSAF